MAESTAAPPVTHPGPGVAPWPADHVYALAPDGASQRAARAAAGDTCWAETGRSGPDDGVPTTVWGLARGSGALPYQTAVDVTGPAYRCSCPSRKIPCKHALGLLLRWSADALAPAPPPGWVRQWLAERATRAETRAGARPGSVAPAPGAEGVAQDRAERDRAEQATGDGRRGVASERTQARRAERVAAGLDEFDRWLTDQVRDGIAGLTRAGYETWDAVAARLVDAQAPTVAGVVRRLAAVAGTPDRLLAELALLRLLVEGFRRLETLPPDLADTVRMRIGLPMPAGEVLARQPRIRDEWHVVGVRDEQEDHLLVRRVWLRGAGTGRPALVLGFAAPGQLLTTDLPLGDRVDAGLCFYPGAQPLRALVAERHSPAVGSTGPAVPTGCGVADALREYAHALAGDPWLERWPVVLSAVVPVLRADRWYVSEPDGTALPVDPAGGAPWRLVGAAGGHPAPVAGEWSAAGLRLLTAWPEGRLVRL